MCLKIIIVLKFLRLSLPGPEPLNSQALVLKTMLNHNGIFFHSRRVYDSSIPSRFSVQKCEERPSISAMHFDDPQNSL